MPAAKNSVRPDPPDILGPPINTADVGQHDLLLVRKMDPRLLQQPRLHCPHTNIYTRIRT